MRASDESRLARRAAGQRSPAARRGAAASPVLLTAWLLAGCSGPAPGNGPDIVDGMARIPEGAFGRGCDAEAPYSFCWSVPEDEVLLDVPYRQITLSEFFIDVHETTREEWAECVDAGACEHTSATVADPEQPGLPAADMTWPAASAYCQWRGKRLPTEAEWEKAARGPDAPPFPWGTEPPGCDTANALLATDWGPDECNARKPLPVNARPKDVSPYGVVGTYGNVQEWTADWADKTYYETAPDEDPPGPEVPNAGSADYRIIRGSYYLGGPGYTYRRFWFRPDEHVPRIGLRCAASDPP